MAMCLLMTVSLAVGCTPGNSETEPDPDPPVQSEFPEYPEKTDMKTDGQYYEQEGVEFPSALWQTPQYERYEALDRGDVKAYFISSVGGTKVFCYVGIPKGASTSAPVPGVVLVHGATGTAFYDWVQAWNERGYAAIAMDTEGRMPLADTSTYHSVYTESIEPHGPANASFTDSEKAVEDQWVYHALASVIASASFLRSFEEVDGAHIGITGVSYGGFLTCLATGYDDRYCFAAPVYGCLSNARGAGEFGTYINNNPGAEIWDGTGALAASRTPVLFVNSDTDNHFTVDSVTRCARASRYAAITLIPGLEHGHSQGAEVKEVFAFADEICKGGTPLARVMRGPENNELEVALPAGVTLAKVSQRYTVGETLSSATVWSEESCDFEDGFVFYSSEEYKAHYYLSLQDNRGFYVSSFVI